MIIHFFNNFDVEIFIAPVNEICKVHADCKNAGKGELTASVYAQGSNVLCPVAVKDNGDGTHDITYSIPSSGTYELTVKYDDVDIPGSPFIVTGYSRTHPEQIGKFFTPCLNVTFFVPLIAGRSTN